MRPERHRPSGRLLPKAAARTPLTLVALLLTINAACTNTPDPIQTTIFTSEPTQAAPDDSALTVVLATTDFGVGENRVAFAMLDSGGAVSSEDVQATFMQEGSEDGSSIRLQPTYREWPGSRGLYTVHANFDAPGVWRLQVNTTMDGKAAAGNARFQVNPASSSPALGADAPASRNKTLQDVASIQELTTDSMPDEGLYSTTVAEALEADMPLVVTFATPAFCRTATCGPQVEVLKDLRTRYPGKVNFIHVEVFDNPVEMGGDLTKGRVSPVLEEWGLMTEPFTFVVDSSGRVSAKFEAFATAEELVEAIEENLA